MDRIKRIFSKSREQAKSEVNQMLKERAPELLSVVE
jgi:hypothetical protein